MTSSRSCCSDRVQETYRQGTWFYLDVLLGSSDIGDLITRTEFVSRVIESNNGIAAELDHTEKTLSRAKVKLDRSLEAVKLKRQEAAKVESHLRGLKADRDRAAAQREAVQGQKADLMVDNKRNAERLRALAEEEEAESERIAAELAAAGEGSGVYGGIMAWPVPASQRITSPYGWRICPFHGRELHKAIDVGAPQGSSIVAAGSGTVIYAGYRGSYGNTIMVDHGNGVVTLYAHQKSGGFRVGTGAQVSRGAAHRYRWQHRQLDRPPPALRGAYQRRGQEPHAVDVGAPRRRSRRPRISSASVGVVLPHSVVYTVLKNV